jgi:hypothetical protein
LIAGVCAIGGQKMNAFDTKAGQRLSDLIEIVQKSNMKDPEPVAEKFIWVFGNIIQEYFADRVFEKAFTERGLRASIEKAIEYATNVFGNDRIEDWPFHQSWLAKYIEGRFLGERKGIFPEDIRSGNRRRFMRLYPKNESKCQWFLGCGNRDNLTIDHIWPWSRHGKSSASRLQWLCQKHNNSWKHNLLFWDNFIPFSKYPKRDMPK